MLERETMGSIDMTTILTLRRAAEALVEDCPEPCWGLAQELSGIAERLSALAGPADEHTCAACGEYQGHANWCIHAFEQAEPELDQDVWGDL